MCDGVSKRSRYEPNTRRSECLTLNYILVVLSLSLSLTLSISLGYYNYLPICCVFVLFFSRIDEKISLSRATNAVLFWVSLYHGDRK